MKNRKAIIHNGIPTGIWKAFCIRRDGIAALTSMFNKIKNGKSFLLDWKSATVYSICNGKETESARDNREFCFCRYIAKYFWESWLVD